MDIYADTIAAIATAPGFGGVGIIRISGPGSKAVLNNVFRPASVSFEDFRPWTLHFGKLVDGAGNVLDEVLAVYMPGPKSFTGEDVAELHCHGGPVILQAALEEIFRNGARLAQPGEFTRRAFMNGRIDLSQAEAVAESIAAPGRDALNAAQGKLGGGLRNVVAGLRENLLNLRANLAMAVDFPEEELEVLPHEEIVSDMQAAREKVGALVSAHKRMRVFREGALVVIAGQVNVGKSSLLNALIGRNRAIVTSQPGTTRDFLEENLLIDGLPVRLVDTAGLRKTRDEVEQQGLKLARELFSEADLILLLVDIVSGPSGYELELLEAYGPGKILGVANKCDLAEVSGPLWPEGEAEKEYAGLREIGWIDVSAKFGQGIETLAKAIKGRLLETGPDGGAERNFAWNIAPNLRQAQALEAAGEEIDGILEDLSLDVPYDLVGVRVELLSAILAEVSGEIAAEDVLDRIFSEFCLGK